MLPLIMQCCHMLPQTDSDIALQKCPQKMQRTLGGFPSDSVLRLVMHSTSRTCHRWPEKDNTHKICEIDLPISGRIRTH